MILINLAVFLLIFLSGLSILIGRQGFAQRLVNYSFFALSFELIIYLISFLNKGKSEKNKKA